MGFTVGKGSEKGSQKGFWERGFQQVPRTPPWRVPPLGRVPCLSNPRLAPVQPWFVLEQETFLGLSGPRPKKTACSFPYRCSGKSRNSGLVPGNRDPKGSSPNRAMQVCESDAIRFCNPRCESHAVSGLGLRWGQNTVVSKGFFCGEGGKSE